MISLCLLFPVSQVWLVVDVVLRHKDDPRPRLSLRLCVNKLCVLEILLAVHALAPDLSLLPANLYER